MGRVYSGGMNCHLKHRSSGRPRVSPSPALAGEGSGVRASQQELPSVPGSGALTPGPSPAKSGRGEKTRARLAYPNNAKPHYAEKNAEPRGNPRFKLAAIRRQVRRVRIVRTFSTIPFRAQVVIAPLRPGACASLKTRAYSRRFGRGRRADRLISVPETPAGGEDTPSRGKDEH